MKPGPADRILETLRTIRPDAYRCHPTDPHRWLGNCEACHQPLVIVERYRDGPVILMCAGGCDEPAILDALEHALKHPPDAEHAAELTAQIQITEADFARQVRARNAQHEVQAWPSTTTTSTTPASPAPTTSPPGDAAAASFPTGRPTRATPPAATPCG